ncbi:MAG: hypothetical protein AAF078_08125 [Planctomycetota bacterium]
MPAHTVAANTPIRLSLKRRAAIAAATLALLAASTAAAWVNTQLVGAHHLAPLDIDGQGVLIRLAPAWQPLDPDDPLAGSPGIPNARRFVDASQPTRILQMSEGSDNRPAEALAIDLRQAIIDALDDTVMTDEPVAIRFFISSGFEGLYTSVKSTNNDNGAITHHQVAILQADGPGRWAFYMADALPPGEPLPNAREVENNQVFINVFRNIRRTSP